MSAAPAPHPAATHYSILGLTAAMLAEQKDPNAVLKRAYHRALLQHHPDKKPSGSTAPLGTAISIDQIAAAFAVLSDPKQRAVYDAALRLAMRDGATGMPQFQTGVEDVDLDDLDYDDSKETWSRSCRCGNPCGYAFDEEDLEQAADDGELMVGCMDCSLWLRVHFAVFQDEQDKPMDSHQ